MDYPEEDNQIIADLVDANHILAHYGVLDGFGHITARSKARPDIYYMSRVIAPALVQADGILALDLDSQPIDPEVIARGRELPADASVSLVATGGGILYGERFIHGQIYKARADVGAVVHSHSSAVVTFGISTTPFIPVIHMAGFLNASTPIFDISDEHNTGGMLVLTNPMGAAVARTLSDNPMVLMRGHGDAVVGKGVRQAVFRAMYAELNATIQMQAIALGGGVKGLTQAEIDYQGLDISNSDRPWEMWKYVVGRSASHK